MNSSVTFELGILDILLILGFMWFLTHMADIGKDLFWEWFDKRVAAQEKRLKAETLKRGYTPTPPPRKPPVNLPPRTERDQPQEGPMGKRKYEPKHATDPNMKPIRHHTSSEPTEVYPHIQVPPMPQPGDQVVINLGAYTPPPRDETIIDAEVVEDDDDPLLRSRAEQVKYTYYLNGHTVHRRDCGVVKTRVDNHELDPWLWANDEAEAVDYARQQELHLCGNCRPGEVRNHA